MDVSERVDVKRYRVCPNRVSSRRVTTVQSWTKNRKMSRFWTRIFKILGILFIQACNTRFSFPKNQNHVPICVIFFTNQNASDFVQKLHTLQSIQIKYPKIRIFHENKIFLIFGSIFGPTPTLFWLKTMHGSLIGSFWVGVSPKNAPKT